MEFEVSHLGRRVLEELFEDAPFCVGFHTVGERTVLVVDPMIYPKG